MRELVGLNVFFREFLLGYFFKIVFLVVEYLVGILLVLELREVVFESVLDFGRGECW